MMPRPGSTKARVAVVLAVLATLVLAWAVLRMHALHERQARLSERLDRAIAEHAARLTSGEVWAPRPLRGVAVDGNGIALQQAAIDEVDVPVGVLVQGKDGCFEPKADARGWVEQHRELLERLRDASRATSAWPADAADKRALGTKMKFSQAQRALLVLALASPADECLEIAADGVRLAQQLAPGAGLLGLTISGSLQLNAAFAMLGCAPTASPNALARAAAEALMLAQDAPSLGAGDTLELEHLFMSSMARSSLPPSHRIPRDRGDLAMLTQGGRLFDAWEVMLADRDEARDIGRAGYPDAAARWKALAARQHAQLPELLGMDAERYSARDQTTQATLRAVAMLLAALAADAKGSAEPIPRLGDPFAGQPLTLIRALHEPPVVWSSGPDGIDDGGEGDDLVFEAPTARAFCPNLALSK